MKKISVYIVLAISAVMLLSLLAGCARTTGTRATPIPNRGGIVTAAPRINAPEKRDVTPRSTTPRRLPRATFPDDRQPHIPTHTPAPRSTTPNTTIPGTTIPRTHNHGANPANLPDHGMNPGVQNPAAPNNAGVGTAVS